MGLSFDQQLELKGFDTYETGGKVYFTLQWYDSLQDQYVDTEYRSADLHIVQNVLDTYLRLYPQYKFRIKPPKPMPESGV